MTSEALSARRHHAAAADRETRTTVTAALRRIPPLRDADVDGIEISPLRGLNNRTYRLTLPAGMFVLRLPGAGAARWIDRRAEHRNLRAAAAHGLAPHPVFFDERDGLMLSTFHPGEPLTGAALREDGDVRAAVAAVLRRVHQLRVRFAGRFEPFDALAGHERALRGVDAEGPDGFAAAKSRAIAADAPLRRVRRSAPCHHDPWPENLVSTASGLLLVDWEYAAQGDPAWDLADLCAEAELPADTEADLLAAYDASDDPTLADRVACWKPVTHLWWSLWAVWEARATGGDEQLVAYGHQQVAKAAALLQQPRFAAALARLRG